MQFLATLAHGVPSSALYSKSRAIRRFGVCSAPVALFGCLFAQAQVPAAPLGVPGVPAESTVASQAQIASPSNSSNANGEVTEEELRRQLVGKQLFLRGGYLGDSLTFNEHGDPVSSPLKASFTLSGIEIDKIKVTKNKVQFEGARYALHFVGDSPYDDPSKEIDQVKITRKKKIVRITIDREQVAKQKKPTSKSKRPVSTAVPETDDSGTAGLEQQETAADLKDVPIKTSAAHAAQLLRAAVDKVFAQGIDEKLRVQMPEFWQIYFESQAAGATHRPKDPGVMPANAVDQQAKVLSSLAPQSNQYAQANGIAGRALYRAVIGVDGRPAEIAVLRPIGFGLDESAVESIRKASFQPAIKAGQPVAEALDLSVLFRIYSKQTGATANVAASVQGNSEAASETTIKPGPYSVRQPQAKPE